MSDAGDGLKTVNPAGEVPEGVLRPYSENVVVGETACLPRDADHYADLVPESAVMSLWSADGFEASLRQRLDQFGPLPESLDEGTCRIASTAFFPGGDGFIKPRSLTAAPDIMVVGRDFGTLKYLLSRCKRGCERKTQATWKGILSRLDAAGIDPERCFFTNAFVGYRKAGTNVAVLRTHHDPDFIARCADFLRFQIDELRPCTIVTLGLAAPSVVARLSPELEAWKRGNTFAALDEIGPLVRSAAFGDHHRANVCALVHPSWARLNVGNRAFTDRSGMQQHGVDAEVALLREAIS